MQDETLWERARVGSRDPKEDRYAQCFPANQYRDVASEMQERHREQATLDSLSRLIDFLATARETRTAVITLTDGWRLFGPNPRLGGNISNSRPGGFGGFGGGGGVAVVEGAAAADEADFQAAVGVVAVAVVGRAARRKAGAEAMVTTADAASATFRAPSARPIG